MENTFTTIEKLIQKVENYFRTSLELFKYEAAAKLIDAVSYFFVIRIIATILIFFALFLNIGLSLWIGQELGAVYYGFFIVAFGNLLIALILFVFRKTLIKNPIRRFVFNKLKTENFL